jgi:CRP/FNR family cyclic AMP-dependent transcriptional regulator
MARGRVVARDFMQNGIISLVSALQELGWPSKAAEELARGAHTVSYEKRGTIFDASERADLIYILLSGEAKLQFQAGHGTRLLVAIAQPGQMLGVLAPGAGAIHPEQYFTAEALSHCKVAIIPAARVAHTLHRLPADHVVRVLDGSREQWTRLSCRLLMFLTMSVRERLAHVIDDIAERFSVSDDRGRAITLRLSHDDLAALIGASRPMVSKHLKELAREGVLRRQQGRYILTASFKGDHDGTDGSSAAEMRAVPEWGVERGSTKRGFNANGARDIRTGQRPADLSEGRRRPLRSM